jgi:hypothetical protein
VGWYPIMALSQNRMYHTVIPWLIIIFPRGLAINQRCPRAPKKPTTHS